MAVNMLGLNFTSNSEDIPDQQLVLAVHPHGVFMVTAGFFGAQIFCKRSTDKLKWFCGVAEFLFRLPFFSELLVMANSRAVDRALMQDLLADGSSVAIAPGGIYEQVRTSPDAEVVYFPSNLGFVRLALQNGVPLLPSYIFGENQLYGQNKFFREANKIVYRYLGIGSLFVVGRLGLPWPVFRPTSVYWHFGNLVEVGPPEQNPSDEKVRKVFLQYVSELRRLFAEHAPTRLPPEVARKGLKIVWRGHDEAL